MTSAGASVEAFVIHLARATARKPQVERIVSASPCPARVIDAVDGSALDPAELARILVPEGRLYRPRYPFALSAGEIGCLLSHRRAWRMILDRGLDYGLIFEDDVEIGPDFPAIFEFALARSSHEAYVQFPVRPVGGDCVTLAAGEGLSLVTATPTPLRTSAQLVGRVAAAQLLERTERFDRPVDTLLQMSWKTGVAITTMVPSGVSDRTAASGGSTIKSKKTFADRLSREWKRWRYRRAIALLSQSHVQKTPTDNRFAPANELE